MKHKKVFQYYPRLFCSFLVSLVRTMKTFLLYVRYRFGESFQVDELV